MTVKAVTNSARWAKAWLVYFVAPLTPGCAAIQLPSTQQVCDAPATVRLSLSKRLLSEGQHSLVAEQYLEALSKFKAGLQRLGNAYVEGGALDDTGQRIALAAVEERNGRLQVAAHLLRNALTTRANMYERMLNRSPDAAHCPPPK